MVGLGDMLIGRTEKYIDRTDTWISICRVMDSTEIKNINLV